MVYLMIFWECPAIYISEEGTVCIFIGYDTMSPFSVQ